MNSQIKSFYHEWFHCDFFPIVPVDRRKTQHSVLVTTRAFQVLLLPNLPILELPMTGVQSYIHYCTDFLLSLDAVWMFPYIFVIESVKVLHHCTTCGYPSHRRVTIGNRQKLQTSEGKNRLETRWGFHFPCAVFQGRTASHIFNIRPLLTYPSNRPIMLSPSAKHKTHRLIKIFFKLERPRQECTRNHPEMTRNE